MTQTAAKTNGTGTGEKKQRPGALRAQARMQIHTEKARRLTDPVTLPNGIRPPGLFRFSSLCQQLCEKSSEGDPYADWYLYRIEQEILQLKNRIKQITGRLKKFIEDSGFDVSEASSLKPVTIELNMGNPYGYMAAWLLADFDRMVRLAMTCELLGILDRAQCRGAIQPAEKHFRRVLHLPISYKYTGITRNDIQQNNQVARRACELMGKCPEKIVTGKQTPRHAPASRQTSLSEVKITRKKNRPKYSPKSRSPVHESEANS